MISEDLQCDQIGDAIFFETTPIFGKQRIFISYTDDITGTTLDRYFDKQFRYSFNGGIFYSEWLDLNSDNLQSINNDWIKANVVLSTAKDERSDLKIQFKYTRVGNNNLGVLKFNELILNGTALTRSFQFVATKNTIFGDLVDDNIDVFNLVMNLTEKMYGYGILPNFLDRKNDDFESLTEDEDYLNFWKAASEFYVLIFSHVLRFTKIYWSQDLLCAYLSQKGIFICKCEDIVEMQLIAKNFYDEIRQRGTVEIFRKKGFTYAAGSRFAYKAPPPFYIQPNSPISIDGILYNEDDELPFGWLMISNAIDNIFELISNDKNYHEVLFFNPDTNKCDIKPLKKLTIPAEEESDVLKQYNGEYLRLICYDDKCDEFIYNQVNIKDFGWNIGNSSPLYKGLDDQYGNIVKAYEKNKDFVKTSKYPWFGDFKLVNDNGSSCLSVIIVKSSVSNGCQPISILSSSIT